MRVATHVPLILVALGTLTFLAAIALASAVMAPAAAPVGPMAVAALAGVMFGLALLATRLQGVGTPPRTLLAVALGGALLGGFAAFALMASGAEGGDMVLALAMLPLVLVALAGIGAGARTWG